MWRHRGNMKSRVFYAQAHKHTKSKNTSHAKTFLSTPHGMYFQLSRQCFYGYNQFSSPFPVPVRRSTFRSHIDSENQHHSKCDVEQRFLGYTVQTSKQQDRTHNLRTACAADLQDRQSGTAWMLPCMVDTGHWKWPESSFKHAAVHIRISIVNYFFSKLAFYLHNHHIMERQVYSRAGRLYLTVFLMFSRALLLLAING